jgi:hypothetical protein
VSCAAIVCGPAPCDAPDPVVTLMPLVRSNSGNSCSYAPVNPPDIRTFNCADAAAEVCMISSSRPLPCLRRNDSTPRRHETVALEDFGPANVLDHIGRGDRATYVRCASNSDRPDASQRTDAMCQ